MNLKIRTFATVALLEGISYVLLLAIAMPLKYFFEFPQAVKIVGWAHGIYLCYTSHSLSFAG